MIRSGVSLSQEIVPIDENTVANVRIGNLAGDLHRRHASSMPATWMIGRVLRWRREASPGAAMLGALNTRCEAALDPHGRVKCGARDAALYCPGFPPIKSANW